MEFQRELEKDLRDHLHDNYNDSEEEDNIIRLIFDAASCGNEENATAVAQMLAQGNGL